jgi:hypothetical protein
VHNAWSAVEFVVLPVLGIAAVQALIWIPIIVWWRRRARDAKARLGAAIEAEATIRPPEKGVYRERRPRVTQPSATTELSRSPSAG